MLKVLKESDLHEINGGSRAWDCFNFTSDVIGIVGYIPAVGGVVLAAASTTPVAPFTYPIAATNIAVLTMGVTGSMRNVGQDGDACLNPPPQTSKAQASSNIVGVNGPRGPIMNQATATFIIRN